MDFMLMSLNPSGLGRALMTDSSQPYFLIKVSLGVDIRNNGQFAINFRNMFIRIQSPKGKIYKCSHKIDDAFPETLAIIYLDYCTCIYLAQINFYLALPITIC